MAYVPDPDRYRAMTYRRCGRSGVDLPAISLGLWQNFGGHSDRATARAILTRAFDLGVTHFDLANNYGPPYGSAESTFGSIYAQDFKPHRDELLISTKAGYDMWPGPYGNWGSRKYLTASLDQSLARMGLDYVDIFYSHRPDPETPMEETMGALSDAVRRGKALYAGISNYSPQQTFAAASLLRSMGTPLLIHQMRYSLLDRTPEGGLLEELRELQLGSIAFSPLAQGLLTDRYLDGVPADSRAASGSVSLSTSNITEQTMTTVRGLNEIARARGQKLAELALAWTLRPGGVTSALIGASSVGQLEANLAALKTPAFAPDELAELDRLTANTSANA